MLQSTGRNQIYGAEALLPVDRRESSLMKRRSPARGILIGLAISAILWLVIVLAIMSLLRD
ncbi:hypothetical protein [Plastoroseomonas arctica]|uniref:Uncharacterized protein n=1 Tax=Plastoroseomonas arctica TaxID=1509237 RepID=A0AAF1K5Z8_9PROT|nr:hypothetical protein [Plastoroseomonas arctica]MBR0657125.1 hypothetical protein [Plastoroseomonas arctica]